MYYFLLYVFEMTLSKPRHRGRCPYAAWPSCKKCLSIPRDGSTSRFGAPVNRSNVTDLKSQTESEHDDMRESIEDRMIRGAVCHV